MSAWAAALLAGAERTARQHYDGASLPLDQLARAAAQLDLGDTARRLAAERERVQPAWLAGLAPVYAALGDRKALDDLRARTPLDAAHDPAGVQAWTIAAAYQALGDDGEADRIVATIADADARTSALAVLIHAAVEGKRPARAASLARALALAPLPSGGGLSTVTALAAGSTDAATAKVTAPAAEAAALALGDESRDETLTSVARLWLVANRPEEALRIARPIARRARRDSNASWYTDLAHVLVDGGDAAAGEELFDRHMRWYEMERTAEGSARAALAASRWGRSADGESFADEAGAKLETQQDAGRADAARRALVDAHLVLGEIGAAIKVAAQVTAADERIGALLAIAIEGHERGIDESTDIDAALEEVNLTGA